MVIGILTIQIELAGCGSLKEKRSLIKPLIARLHREFNISVAEIEKQDHWQSAVVGCALLCNDAGYAQKALQEVLRFTERTFPHLAVLEFHIEIVK